MATDTDWERGRDAGPRTTVLEGPMLELLLLCAGRQPDAARLTQRRTR
ncbi:hypothetical protein [Nocardioides sambongensis]|nr:hypothetical protein [Nocardioides sambongensis]